MAVRDIHNDFKGALGPRTFKRYKDTDIGKQGLLGPNGAKLNTPIAKTCNGNADGQIKNF